MTEYTGVLSAGQRERAEALTIARGVLVSKAFVASGAADASALLTVAEYVVNGMDNGTVVDAEAVAQAVVSVLDERNYTDD